MLGQLAPAPHRVGVAVDPEYPAAGGAEQRHAVAAAAESTVYINSVVARHQGGEHSADQHGNVRRLSSIVGLGTHD
jgi:hypothetical protein